MTLSDDTVLQGWGEAPPYARLGREALAAVSEDALALGAAGAGWGAMAGAHRGGLGAASWTESGVTVGAVVAVNSFGSPYVPGTDRFWAAPWEQGREFGGRGVATGAGHAGLPPDTKLGAPARANTTIALVATDAAMTKAQAHRLAVMAQNGLARAIRPAHGPTDGDVVFAMAGGSAGDGGDAPPGDDRRRCSGQSGSAGGVRGGEPTLLYRHAVQG